ncbi:hypothetical protein [Paenibacillus sp. OK003]|uniref:hypothetical protein n=1 Tax=Paenibacillus sp. OK003 TaxID=1884380 RepID=UPI0008D45E7F|nr:hypothetical protein [Paenibacillus sp. OK003]SEK87212.1 hypothetical protein SAMN05518856_105264 [Paenibacillus sp. OK003]
MTVLSTGPIDNSPVLGVNPSSFVTVRIVNRDLVNSSALQIYGYILNGERTMYVSELIEVFPNQVLTRNYSTNFVAYEFVFTITGAAVNETEVSVWGKTSSGELVDAHRLVSAEQLGSG